MRFRSTCAAVVSLSALSGCPGGDRLERAGVALRPPADWRPVATTTWPVPGVPLAAWSGPNGASLVVYHSLPVSDGRPEGVATELTTRLSNLPGLRVVSGGTETVAGATVARVEVSAPGTGDALAPTGRGAATVGDGKPLLPTRRVVVVFVRPADTLSLVWHAPESASDALAAAVRETLRTLTVRDSRAASQSY